MKRKLLKIIIIIISLVLVIIGIIYAILQISPNIFIRDYEPFDNYIRQHGLVSIGKSFNIHIESTDFIDYKLVAEESDNNKLRIWVKSEREKLAKYMKDNNVKIKEGDYIINQGTSYERALEIFEFEVIKSID